MTECTWGNKLEQDRYNLLHLLAHYWSYRDIHQILSQLNYQPSRNCHGITL